MPFVGLVHESEPQEPFRERPPWEPNWRIWRWVMAAAAAAFAATRSDGALETLLVFVAFGLCCQAAAEALPDGDGLRHWRQ
ncbi:MAG TPA: hypothetical protein VK307_05690 [Thermoleophilaceae bacterium]|nr:hypothetical protein [Thermoleophilaceae bacterium]